MIPLGDSPNPRGVPFVTYGLIAMPMDAESHIGFSLNSAWVWFKPLHADAIESDSGCSNLVLPDHLSTTVDNLAASLPNNLVHTLR